MVKLFPKVKPGSKELTRHVLFLFRVCILPTRMLISSQVWHYSIQSSTNPLSAPIKSNACNLSLNGSASESHHGSNVDPGNNATLPGKARNMEPDIRISEKEGTASLMRLEAPTLTLQNQFARREAALNKFRLKRKERCYEKRVI